MFRHIFVYDSNFIRAMSRKTLLDESPSPQATVSHVDIAVNSCALICVLLFSTHARIVVFGSSRLLLFFG
jgi:hypothetical protein